MLIGTTFLILAPIFSWSFFLILLILSLGAVFLIHASDVAILKRVIDYFDRDDAYLPGYGALALIAGFLVATLLFPLPIALPALTIMVFGDGIATLAGTYFGRHHLMWNKGKSWEGLLMGLLAGWFAATFFTPTLAALIASTIALIGESLRKPAWLDDNYLLPIIAGLIFLII